MSLQDSAVAASRLHRGSANYHPTLWGDYFLTNISDFKTTRDPSIQEEYDVLKEEIGRTLKKDIDDHASEKLELIDLTQRLGIAYHFKTEIEDAIQKICHDSNYHNNYLHNTALRFRLLRQQGIKVSCDIFEGFKDSEGKFKKSLITDVVGLLSLYQAAFLSIRGEDVLDEAIDFTTTNLQLILPHLSPNLAEEVRHALNRPIHECLPRLEARQFIDFYHRDESHNSTLLKFAKLDFNMLQETHQEELKYITDRWWKRLDYTTKLPYARDRIVECYFWVMGVYFEPQYSFARKMLTKVIAMLSILDDTYDNYATCEELDLFTDAIQRWDVEAINALPEYMRMIFHNLLDVYNEIEEITNKEGRSFAMHYAKESLKRAVRAYLAEAKWRDKGYIPSMEEYMQVSPVSTSFVGMGEIATKDAFEWIYSDPKIVRAASVICRLMDIVSHQFEQKRKHVASGVECYIKQFGIFEEDVIKLFRKEIADAWKDMNEECLRPFPISMDLLERVLNLARVMDVIYKDDDGYTNSYILKGYVASLLKDPLL